MPARFELTFDITQAELAAANEAAMRVQPEWERARKLARRSIRNFAIFGVPAAVFLVAAFVGRGSGTRGMYLEGGLGGLLIGGVIAFGLSRLDPVGQEIERTAKRLRKARAGKAAVVKGPGKRLTADKKAAAGAIPPWTSAEIEEAFRRFQAADPNPEGELEHINPFTLLVAVVLSAQAYEWVLAITRIRWKWMGRRTRERRRANRRGIRTAAMRPVTVSAGFKVL